MTARILILPIVSLGTRLLAGNPPPNEKDAATAKPQALTSAKAKITVESSEAQPYDQGAGPALLEIHWATIVAWSGEARVTALPALRESRSSAAW